MQVMGIDVSKDKLDCKISEVEKAYGCSNSIKGFNFLIKLIKKYKVQLVVLESTGGYERDLFRYLWSHGHKVALLNPRQVRSFAHSLGRRAKNDLIDSELLLLYGERMNPTPNEPVEEDILVLRELLTRRNQLNKMLVAEKNHLSAPGVSSMTRKSVKALLNSIKTQIKAMDVEILKVIGGNESLSEKSKKLSAQTGVGPVLMVTLLADMPELGTLKRNQASALVGVAPYDRDSGTFQGKRAIAGGRVRLRCALYMATLSAIRHNPIIKEIYLRLVSRGKPKKVALVACMRKFIIYLNTVLKEDPSQHFMAESV
ncbi:IS110 family transposase [Candidatus Saccharibacteria bacterium]|nr:IS110 family transposase [Candidatus Saccharibacteria bacterium]